MAIWQKVFSRRNWQNEPSTATPLNETNLNVGDAALDAIDNRVIELNNRTIELEGYETAAAQSATEASNSALDSEAWAVGQRDGTDVPSSDDTYHNNSKYYANKAATSEANASTSEQNASDYADDAHGWADNKGDSGQSAYSATNNAYYWAQQAQQAAGGGVTSFNNRTGPVMPATGDYNGSQIKTSVAKTGSGTTVTNTIAANTAMDNAIGTLLNNTKALNDDKLSKTGDSQNNTVTYTSADDVSVFNSGNLAGQSTYAWSAVAKIVSAEKHSSLFNKVSTMFKNIRTIAKLIGTTDISSIGTGTISNAISTINSDLSEMESNINAIPKIQHGQAHTPSTGAIWIDFSQPFQSPPHICATFINNLGSPVNAVTVSVKDVRVNGFTVYVVQNNTGLEADVYWIAVGV